MRVHFYMKKRAVAWLMALAVALSSLFFFSVPVYVKANRPPTTNNESGGVVGGGHYHSAQPGQTNAETDDENNSEPSFYGDDNAPFDILNDNGKRSVDSLTVDGMSESATDYLMKQAGLPTIAYILDLVAVVSGVLLAIVALVMLILVNYPKTVAQVKQKIGQIFLILIVVAVLPVIFDFFYSLVRMLMGYNLH